MGSPLVFFVVFFGMLAPLLIVLGVIYLTKREHRVSVPKTKQLSRFNLQAISIGVCFALLPFWLFSILVIVLLVIYLTEKHGVSAVPPPEAVETGKRVPAWLSWLRATNVWQAAFVRPFVTDRKGLGYGFCYMFGMMFLFLGFEPVLDNAMYGPPGHISSYPAYEGTITYMSGGGRGGPGLLSLLTNTGDEIHFRPYNLGVAERRKLQPGVRAKLRGIPSVRWNGESYLSLAEAQRMYDGSYVLKYNMAESRESYLAGYAFARFIFILGGILFILPTLRNWKPVTNSKPTEKSHVPN